MRSANRACEREKLEDFSAARGDSEPKSASHAISYAKNFSRSRDAVIRVYDAAGNVIETHEQKAESSTYTRFGPTLTISGERNAPRWF